MRNYTFILNVNLTVSPARIMGALFKVKGARPLSFKKVQTDGGPVAVIAFDWAGDVIGNGDDFEFKKQLTKMAKSLGQPRMGVFNKTDSRGVLIGSGVTEPGSFSLDTFYQ